VTDHESTSPAQRFTALYADAAPRVYLYAARHVGPDHADDVVSEAFTVAWRRLDDVPAGDGLLPWMLVVARNVIANQRRSQGRKERLAHDAELVGRLETVTADVAVDVAERDALIRALADLSEREREAVLLVGWDGLTSRDAATVAGCSPGAFNVRLHRARQRLQRSVEPQAASGTAAPRTPLAPEATR
jgi:RNA polymerase sigma factor (sigma-70 family)